MNNLLLIERSFSKIDSTKVDEGYTLEGVFTELGKENRNGRVYTKEEFIPHIDKLKKVVENGNCVGELDHPKQFETSLKNVSHKITDIWLEESTNQVKGKIELLDTDAGRQAKALVDAGIPLHISSRAAGTVSENKSVKINKLFTYDLVADPGFENAVLHTINESLGFTEENVSNFLIFDLNESNTNSSSSVDNLKLTEMKNKYESTISELSKQITELTEKQNALIEHNNDIVNKLNSINESNITTIIDDVNALKSWSDHVTESVTNVEQEVKAIEKWSDHVTESVTKIENWTDHATETVSNIETWSNHVVESVTKLEEDNEAIEAWSNHTTETVTNIETWSNHVVESVTKLEESNTEIENNNNNTNQEVKIEESEVIVENNESESYISDLTNKIDSIIESAKKQKAEQLNESIESEKETINEFEKNIPNKYKSLWESLDDSKKASIEKKSSLYDFTKDNVLIEFWDSVFSTNIKIEKSTVNETVTSHSDKSYIIEAYRSAFNK